MTQEQARTRAKKLVKFYYNVFIFVIINIFLYVLDFYPDSKINWAYWVTFGWGLGVLIEGFNVYFGSNLEDKIAKDLMDKNQE
jgi:2TM domain